ncbi:MAG: response regulator [Chitinophagaceae bacterium]|nr:response regulator [Oligoflexus sp.]
MPLNGSTRIMIIENDIDVAEQMRTTLKNHFGFENLSVTYDGRQAWLELNSAAENNASVDLVISDWQMPHLTGLELLQKMRADDKLRKMPFIMVSGLAGCDQTLQAIKAGANDYITKPLQKDILVQRITEMFDL